MEESKEQADMIAFQKAMVKMFAKAEKRLRKLEGRNQPDDLFSMDSHPSSATSLQVKRQWTDEI